MIHMLAAKSSVNCRTEHKAEGLLEALEVYRTPTEVVKLWMRQE
jgi:hypothetical protein